MLSTPSLKGSKIPPGHVLLNSKYHKSSLGKEITEVGLQILYDDLGLIDCYTSTNCGVVIATENAIISELELKVKLKQLLKYKDKKVVLFALTETSEQYLRDFQQKIVRDDWDINLILFSSEKEIAVMLSQLNHAEKLTGFSKKSSEDSIEKALVDTLVSISGIGEKKALELLKKFGNLKNIFEAPLPKLVEIVGERAANTIKKM